MASKPEKKAVARNVGFKKTSKKSSFSMQGMLKTANPEEEKVVVEDMTGKPAEKFSLEDLHKAWKTYCNKLKHAGKGSLFATLTRHLPTLASGNIIEYEIDNTVQDEQIGLEKLEMLSFLRTELNNFQLQLKVKLNHSDDTPLLYTTRDKFTKMAEKNPSLDKLRDLLNLDLDY